MSKSREMIVEQVHHILPRSISKLKFATRSTLLATVTPNQAHIHSNAGSLPLGAKIPSDSRPSRRHSVRPFIDHVRVKFQGGRGGDGCISMSHLFCNEFAGPDGGNGGCGGHIVLRADQRVKSLRGLHNSYRGLDGDVGSGKCLFGKNAEHIFIDVPVGTSIVEPRPKELAPHEFDPEKSDQVAELDQHGSMFIAARGGAGGRGNASFLSNKNRHPRIAEAGAHGEENTWELRMRIYAHFGLIGLPNAGKSTLLNGLTNSRVKVGDYEFTTTYPQVGIIEYDDYTQLAISDLPGLIEDANKNRGLGLQFLRHVKRCVCLLYVVDLVAARYTPEQQLEILFHELDQFSPGLSKASHAVLANKIDAPGAQDRLGGLREFLARERPETKLLVASASRGDNVGEIRTLLREFYDRYQAEHADDQSEAFTW